jgi:hypothetical protein
MPSGPICWTNDGLGAFDESNARHYRVIVHLKMAQELAAVCDGGNWLATPYPLETSMRIKDFCSSNQ